MRHISAITLIVPSYEAGLAFYVGVLGFALIEDSSLSPTKRWVLVAPSPNAQTRLLLAQAVTPGQANAIGDQAGGRVFLFLETEDFKRDFDRLSKAGVRFLEAPRQETYGRVVVFADPFGNKWDLIQRSEPDVSAQDRAHRA